jgi:hypothetical protein
MSAPNLPPAFGNYALGEGFVELSFADAISWLPQTPGWWFVGTLILIWLARISWRGITQWYRDRYRREAGRRLASLERQKPGPDWLLELNRLLKLTALAAYSRERVASLSGPEWVEFLNSECPEPLFLADSKKCLAENIYGEHALTEENKSELVAASRQWIVGHRGKADV